MMVENINFQPANIEGRWNRAIHIDKGSDSEVRGFGSVVIKRYPDLSRSQLELYKQATDEVARILNNKKITTPIGSSILRVNPIDQVIESPRDFTMYTTSSFIKGANTHDLLLKKGQRFFNKYDSTFAGISENLIRETNIGGIFIIPYNVLLADFGKKGFNQLIITDISSHIGNLARL